MPFYVFSICGNISKLVLITHTLFTFVLNAQVQEILLSQLPKYTTGLVCLYFFFAKTNCSLVLLKIYLFWNYNIITIFLNPFSSIQTLPYTSPCPSPILYSTFSPLIMGTCKIQSCEAWCNLLNTPAPKIQETL